MIEHVPVKFSALIAPVAGVLLLVSACTGNQPQGTAESTHSPNAECAPTPGVGPDSVSLAVVLPKSGSAREFFRNFDSAAQLRIDEANRLGGIFDRRIVLKTYDDRNDAATQIQVAKEALAGGAFGLIAASQQQAMYPALAQAGVPVTGLPNLPPYASDLNAFGAYGAYSTTYASTAAAERFKGSQAKSIAVVASDSPGARLAVAGFIATLAPSHMQQAGTTQVVGVGQSQMSQVAARIKDSRATGVNVVSLVETGASLMRELKRQHAAIPVVLVNGLASPRDVEVAAGALEGALGAPYGFVPLQLVNREVKRYVAGMAAKGLDPYAPIAPIGYVSADLMLTGLASAGQCPTRSDFIRILRGVTDYLGAGLLPGKVSFAPGVTPDGDPQKCTWFLTVRGTALLPDDNATCGVLINTVDR